MGKKGEPQRTAFRRDRDEAEAAKMYLLGKNQQQIAAALGLSQATVSRDLQRVRRRWREQAIRDMARVERGDRAWAGLLQQIEDGG